MRAACRGAEGQLHERLLEVALRRCARAARRPCRVATVRPCATTTTLSHSRSTSCMMWVEKTMHLPPPAGVRSQRRLSRRARVASTSRPLVGSSSTMLAGSCTSARASAVFMRSPWLKPSVRRSSSARHVEHARQLLGARVGRVARHAVQGAVVDDVLARRQPRVEAARSRTARPCRASTSRGRVDDVDAVDRAACRRRA